MDLLHALPSRRTASSGEQLFAVWPESPVRIDMAVEGMAGDAELGAAGGMLVGLTVPKTDDEVDGLMLGALDLGFRETLKTMRRGNAN